MGVTRVIGFAKRVAKLGISMLYFLGRSMLRRGRNEPAAVLYYHSISSAAAPRFEKQMSLLSRILRPVNIRGMEGPGRKVLVTFDDGFLSVAENAFPVLTRNNVPALIFIPMAYLGLGPAWLSGTGHPDADQEVMTEDAVRRCARKGGVEIGSHLITHRDLRSLDDQDAERELHDSKSRLEGMLGVQVESVSFPFGGYLERHLTMAEKAGYRWAFTISPHAPMSYGALKVVGRVKTGPEDWLVEFALKALGAYEWLGKRPVWASAAQEQSLKFHSRSGM